ncbi:Uncharacterised protein g3919 [Pycnogonum litorale]
MAANVGIGLGDSDIQYHEVRGDIDFDFFEAEKKPCANSVAESKGSSEADTLKENVRVHDNVRTDHLKNDEVSNDSLSSEETRYDDDYDGSNESYGESSDYSSYYGKFLSPTHSAKSEQSLSNDFTVSSSSEQSVEFNRKQHQKDVEISDDSNRLKSSKDAKKKESVKFADHDETTNDIAAGGMQDEEDADSADDNLDMKLLVQAISELGRQSNKRPDSEKSTSEPKSVVGRKNLSFSNDRVSAIDKENRRLLNKLLRIQKPKKISYYSDTTARNSSANINRTRQLRRVEQENTAFLQKLNKTKATKELSRDHLFRDYDKKCQYGVSPFPHSSSKRPGSVASSMISNDHCSTPQSVTSVRSLSKSRRRREWNDRW